jgi:hypothetical protein
MMSGWLDECEMNELSFMMNIGRQEGISCSMSTNVCVRYGERMNEHRGVVHIQGIYTAFTYQMNYMSCTFSQYINQRMNTIKYSEVKVKVNQSLYRPRQAHRVPGGRGFQIS